MEGELFWLFYDDVFSSWIPPNHMMVFRTFKKTGAKEVKIERARHKNGGAGAQEDCYLRVEFCKEGSLGLRMARLVGFWSGRLVRLFLRMFVIRGDGARGRGWWWRLLSWLLLVLLG